MKKSLIVLSLFLLSSCNNDKFIHYIYKNVIITRTDTNGVCKLYYGNFSPKDRLPSSYITTSYKGSKNFMNGVLLFQKDKRVVLIAVEDRVFKKIGKDSSLILAEFPNIPDINGGDSIIEIEDEIKFEKIDHKKLHSNVTAFYY